MAKQLSAPIPTRTLDVAMFKTPAGMPSSEFKRELENQLLEVSQFMAGVGVEAGLENRIPIAHWHEDEFKVDLHR
jgi:hypothetical protein